MISRIVLALDDSPPSLAALDVAIDLAAGWHAEIIAVFVHESPSDAQEAVADHAAAVARDAGVAFVEVHLKGQPFEAVLEEARRRDADLIVVGRSDRRRPGSPHVGSQTEHVLEFTDRPVLVVPFGGRE
jgi:nucleotide-binding universal stress UspA family protein